MLIFQGVSRLIQFRYEVLCEVGKGGKQPLESQNGRVEIPMYNGGGLYELDVDANWSLVESVEGNGKWVEVYRYDDVLMPGAATTVLADKRTWLIWGWLIMLKSVRLMFP